MSSTKFRKDKEIIADYEIQVKGAVVWMSVSVLCALSLQSLTHRLCQARRCIAFLLCTIVINREYSPPWFCLNNAHHMSCKHPAGICSLVCEAWFRPRNRFSRYFNSSQGDFCDPGSALCCCVKWSPCCNHCRMDRLSFTFRGPNLVVLTGWPNIWEYDECKIWTSISL